MSSSPKRPARDQGNPSPATSEDATISPPDPALVTAAYVPKQVTSGKLPAQFPASFGRYQLQKLLGQGGMGAVYLAHDTQLDRPVALKIPIFNADEGSQVLARFYREARAAATILHTNVCPVYDVGEVDGVPYLTMAYIEGKSLDEWLSAKPLLPRQSATLVRKLALALQEAHKKGVIHRDLKPANIMIDKRGEPVIMDFGLARRNRSGDARLTLQGTVMGTPAYMPPEQVSGKSEAMGPACDIYSLGVILYELLAGRLPFTGDPMAMLSQVLLDEPPPPSKFRPGIDAELEKICKKAMAKKAEGRYRSMGELATVLFEYLRAKTVTTERPATMAPPAAPVRAEPEAVEVETREIIRPSPPRSKPPSIVERRAEPIPERTTRRNRRRKADRDRERPWWPWMVGAAGILLLLLLAATIYRVTDYGTIRIDVSDESAAVELIVDEEDRGAPGQTFRVRAGVHHFVKVVGPDYDTEVHGFTVHRGHNSAMPPIPLTPRFGTIRLALSEPNAPVKVYFDGSAIPVPEPNQPLRLSIGEHHLRVIGEGYENILHHPFTVHAGVNPPLTIELRRAAAPPNEPNEKQEQAKTPRSGAPVEASYRLRNREALR